MRAALWFCSAAASMLSLGEFIEFRIAIGSATELPVTHILLEPVKDPVNNLRWGV